MNKTVMSVWMALAIPALHDAGRIAPVPTPVPAAILSASSAESGNAAESASALIPSELPLLLRILLTPPPDLRATWPDLEAARRMEAFFSVQQ